MNLVMRHPDQSISVLANGESALQTGAFVAYLGNRALGLPGMQDMDITNVGLSVIGELGQKDGRYSRGVELMQAGVVAAAIERVLVEIERGQKIDKAVNSLLRAQCDSLSTFTQNMHYALVDEDGFICDQNFERVTQPISDAPDDIRTLGENLKCDISIPRFAINHDDPSEIALRYNSFGTLEDGLYVPLHELPANPFAR